MARWSYPQVEGVLYGLNGRPDARVASPRLRSPGNGPRGPAGRGPFPETVRRLDVDIALHSLDVHDRVALETHYLNGGFVPKQVRRRAVKRLVLLLERP